MTTRRIYGPLYVRVICQGCQREDYGQHECTGVDENMMNCACELDKGCNNHYPITPPDELMRG